MTAAAPSSGGGGCGGVLMMVIAVIIAVVVAVVTYGAGTAISASLVGGATGAAATVSTVAIFAAVGAVVAAAASIIQQGLFMALGYQDEFSWGAVGAAAVAGALSGAASGIGRVAELAKFSAEAMQYAKVANAALRVASVASKQLIENGQITSWTSLAAAGVGGYLKGGESFAQGEAFSNSILGIEDELAGASTSVLNFITPWVQLGETYVRNDYELSATDWANAVGATLNTAVNSNGLGGSNEGNMALRLAGNLLVGGALSNVDKEAGQSYLMNAVGNEVGSYIGQKIGQGLISGLEKLASSMGNGNGRGAAFDGDMSFLMEAPTAGDHRLGDDMWHGVDAAAFDVGFGSSGDGTYTVKSGDTLGQIIVDRYGSYDEETILKVAALNNLADPDKINEGQKLRLPAADSEELAGQGVSDALRESLRGGPIGEAGGLRINAVELEDMRPYDFELDGPRYQINTDINSDLLNFRPSSSIPAEEPSYSMYGEDGQLEIFKQSNADGVVGLFGDASAKALNSLINGGVGTASLGQQGAYTFLNEFTNNPLQAFGNIIDRGDKFLLDKFSALGDGLKGYYRYHTETPLLQQFGEAWQTWKGRFTDREKFEDGIAGGLEFTIGGFGVKSLGGLGRKSVGGVGSKRLVGLEKRVGGSFDMAIGIATHQNGSPTMIKNFAKRTNSKTYEDIYGGWGYRDYNQLGGRILSGLDESKAIHVNLDRMISGTDNIAGQLTKIMKQGKGGGLSRNNITNWEVYQILKNSNRRSKATFYYDGKPLDLPDIPYRVWPD